MRQVLEWCQQHATLMEWLVVLSLLMFFGTILVVPVLVARIPDDYFIRDRHAPNTFPQRHWVLSALWHLIKNVLGVVIMLAGLAMLFLPGQGLLTILIGVMLIDFPGKRRLELWLIRRPSILKAVNWMRGKAGRSELLLK